MFPLVWGVPADIGLLCYILVETCHMVFINWRRVHHSFHIMNEWMYRSPEYQAYHYYMTEWVISLLEYIVLVVGFQPPHPHLRLTLTAPRLWVTSWYVQWRTCIRWCRGWYHTCIHATTSYTTPTIRRRLIQWTNKRHNICMGANIADYSYVE